jgi:hypothetical protein
MCPATYRHLAALTFRLFLLSPYSIRDAYEGARILTMKTSVLSKIMMVGVLALSAVVSVSAQTGTDGGRATDGTTMAGQTARDDNRDWGWVGLIGLLGLTGLLRRHESHDRVPDTTTRATSR